MLKEYKKTDKMDIKVLGLHFAVVQMEEKQMIEFNLKNLKIRFSINKITMINNIN